MSGRKIYREIPDTEKAVENAVEISAEDIEENVDKSVVEKTEESVAEKAEESVAGNAEESVAENAEESVAEKAEESVTEKAEESVAGNAVESMTENAEERAVHKLREALEQADTVIIGAGAGLSTSTGFEYTGDRFEKYFRDFSERYGFQDMYSGGFYPYETLEEYWAYWSRHIYCNRYTDSPKPVYHNLLKLVKDKDYFVLTTNVDHCFQKAGFDKKRLFYTRGDYGLFQCSQPCHRATYDNRDQVFRMMTAQGFAENREGNLILPEGTAAGRVIPSELIPRCPRCGRAMTMNLRADSTFVEDAGWHEAAERYSLFLHSHRDRKVLFLEVGTGYNTPGIIKYSFWQMTAQWPEAVYACLNFGEAFAPDEIKNKSVCINDDAGTVIERLLSPAPELS